MTVNEIMTKEVGVCAPQNPIEAAAKIMRDRKCGFVPVVDGQGAVVGVITDRDICNAVALKHRTAEHIGVRDVMSHPIFTCFTDENVKSVLVTMAKHHVRRLPVLDKSGHLQGVLSMDDVVLAPHRRGSPTSDEVVEALKGICGPRQVERVSA